MPTAALPAPPTTLIGRATELNELKVLLRDGQVRLLTLVGPPGVGKTRLAIRVATDQAAEYADGVRFVSLASLEDADLVVPVIASALGLSPRGDPRPTLDAYLRDRHMLLVVDNLEHVLDAASDLAELVRAAPRLTLLVTSSVTLRLSGEYTYRLRPLELPPVDDLPGVEALETSPAVALFVDRARAVRPDFELTAQNAATVAQICQRLDGLPLAIELAAVRIKLLGPRALLLRLSDRLAGLGKGAQDRPTRQKTLRTALAWSYELLDPEMRRLFADLGVFAGGCSVPAAEAVCSSEDAGDADDAGAPGDGEAPEDLMLDRLETLVDHSLLQAAIGPDGEPRFSMFPTVREYAVERLRHEGREDALSRRHAAYYRSLAEKGGPTHEAASNEHTERDNFSSALAWAVEAGQVEIGLGLASALWRDWQRHGRLTYGRKWLTAVLALPGSEGPARADALCGAGVLARFQGEVPESRRLLTEATALWRRLGYMRGLAETLTYLGMADHYMEDFDAAREHLDEALTYWRGVGEGAGLARALSVRAGLANHEGDVETAASMRLESLELCRARGDREGVGQALLGLGEVARCRVDLEGARGYCLDALAVFRELNDAYHQGSALHNLGYLERRRGDVAAARACFLESLEHFEGMGHRFGVVSCVVGLAGVRLDGREPREAALLLAAADRWRQELGVLATRADRGDWDEIHEGVRALLDEDELERLERRSTLMSTSDVLRLAREPVPAEGEADEASDPGSPGPGAPAPAPGEETSGARAAMELTDRERDVLRLLAEGLTYGEIGKRLYISDRTVDAHLRSIYPKLEVHSRHAAVRAARLLGLL